MGSNKEVILVTYTYWDECLDGENPTSVVHLDPAGLTNEDLAILEAAHGKDSVNRADYRAVKAAWKLMEAIQVARAPTVVAGGNLRDPKLMKDVLAWVPATPVTIVRAFAFNFSV